MQIHPLIETSAALAEFVNLIKGSDFIAVDTEFMRENTFWPELCLIQVADSDHAAAIDPMAPGMDLKPLLDLLVELGGSREPLPDQEAGYAADQARHAAWDAGEQPRKTKRK